MSSFYSVPSNNDEGAASQAQEAPLLRADGLAQLVSRIAAGDQQALAQLYDETNRLVYSLIYRILGESGAAEEITLDVYMQVWRQAGRYDTQRGALLTWLVTIARSRAIDYLRATRQHLRQTDQLDLAAPPPQPAQVYPDAEKSALLSERGRIIRRALAKLPSEQREALELSYFLGLSHSEIALQLGQPLGTVKTRTRLGMMKLRNMLRPVLEGQV